MIDIQLYRARIGVFTNMYGVSLERSKGKKGYPSHSKGSIKINNFGDNFSSSMYDCC